MGSPPFPGPPLRRFTQLPFTVGAGGDVNNVPFPMLTFEQDVWLTRFNAYMSTPNFDWIELSYSLPATAVSPPFGYVLPVLATTRLPTYAQYLWTQLDTNPYYLRQNAIPTITAVNASSIMSGHNIFIDLEYYPATDSLPGQSLNPLTQAGIPDTSELF